MNERDKIKTVLDRVVVTDFLIAAVTLIYRVEKQAQRQGQLAGQFDFLTDLEGAIGSTRHR